MVGELGATGVMGHAHAWLTPDSGASCKNLNAEGGGGPARALHQEQPRPLKGDSFSCFILQHPEPQYTHLGPSTVAQ